MTEVTMPLARFAADALRAEQARSTGTPTP